jgi:DNA repair photolyase
MTLVVKEIQAKTILSVSKIYPWVINPYTGCQHGCSYCYARFMKRVTGHRAPNGVPGHDLLFNGIKQVQDENELIFGGSDSG